MLLTRARNTSLVNLASWSTASASGNPAPGRRHKSQTGAYFEQLLTIDEAVGTEGLWREAGPSPSVGRLPLRAFEGSKVGVIGVERAGTSRRAALECLRGR